MSWLGDAYQWVDANLAGGLLPGGHEVSDPGATIAGVVPTPFVGIQPAAAPAAAPAGAGMFGGAAGQAAMGLPVAASAAPRSRGKLVTAVARMNPDGSITPVKMLPGSPVAMSSDLAAVRRVKSAKKRIKKMLPDRRSNRCSKRRK